MGFSGPVSMENAFKISNNRHIKRPLFGKMAFRDLIIYNIFQVHISLFLLPPFSQHFLKKIFKYTEKLKERYSKRSCPHHLDCTVYILLYSLCHVVCPSLYPFDFLMHEVNCSKHQYSSCLALQYEYQ